MHSAIIQALFGYFNLVVTNKAENSMSSTISVGTIEHVEFSLFSATSINAFPKVAGCPSKRPNFLANLSGAYLRVHRLPAPNAL